MEEISRSHNYNEQRLPSPQSASLTILVPTLKWYWEARKLKKIKTLAPQPKQLAYRQKGKCPLIGDRLFIEKAIEKHHIIRRDEDGTDTPGNLVLHHLYCHQQITAAQRKALLGTRQLRL